MTEEMPTELTEARRAEIARLLALALDHLDAGSEQIVRDYIVHAIDALNRIREKDHPEHSLLLEPSRPRAIRTE